MGKWEFENGISRKGMIPGNPRRISQGNGKIILSDFRKMFLEETKRGNM